MEKAEAITLWKKLKLISATMEFSCGGDNMNDFSFTFFDQRGEVGCAELNTYFDTAVFHSVTFYECSDGHYQGEAGTVEITLEDGEEDFCYSKNAESEFEEQHEEHTLIPMPARMIKFIKENVSNINGSYEEEVLINFSKDLILNDKQEGLLIKIQDFLKDKLTDFTPKEINEELHDWRSFTTGDELVIKGNSLKVEMTVSYTRYEPSED